MNEDEYTLLIRDENDPVIFTAFPDHRREMDKFTQMSQDDEAGLKVCFGVNFKSKHVVWMCSSDEVELPNGQCIMDRCTIKIDYVMYDDSYELLKHGKPSNVLFSVPEYLKESGDELFEYFNIIHNVIAERLYDTFIYEIKKLEKAGRSGKLTFRHSTGSIENESKEK